MNVLNSGVAAAVVAALASTAVAAEPTDSKATRLIVHAPAAVEISTVHDWNGQRFDVPNSLLRAPGILINGLPPQPQQFD